MKNTVGLLIILLVTISCNNLSAQEKNENHLINRLEEAENSKDINVIKSIFTEDAVLYTPDMLPINGKAGIISIYNLIFSSQDSQFVKYVVDSSYIENENHIELGINITKKAGQPDVSNDFKAVFKQFGESFQIIELSFGKEENIKRTIPRLLKPTGKYQVGQTSYFYDTTKSDNHRLLSFQVWYPTQFNADIPAVYQNKNIVEASSEFLGIPLFAMSYFSQMESNSFLNVPVFPDNKFPVILYNHGYGGFTSVYQTVFEDLASNGYIVVSIAHENESALILTEEGRVITNSSENQFYKDRSVELNGSKINEFQSVILNSDNLNENQEAYKKLIKLSPLHNQSTRLWESDTKAVYEKLKEINETDTILKEAFDFECFGAIGHSLGGATAGQLGFENDFIKAGINLDGFQFGDLINNRLKIPFMFISSNQQGERYIRATTFLDKSEADCYQVAIKGFSHSSFTDLEYFSQGDSRVIELQRELIRIFFDKYLKIDNIDLKNIESKYENMTLIEKKQP